MTWNDILIQAADLVLKLLVMVAVPLATVWAGKYVKNASALKLIDNLRDTIIDIVEQTNENFVNSLKEQGKFDAEAQKKAWEMSKNQIMEILNESTKEAILLLYGDIEKWIDSQIVGSVTTLKIQKATVGLYVTRKTN